MNQSPRRHRATVLVAAVPLLLGGLLTGCSDDASEGGSDSGATTEAAAGGASAATGSPEERQLAFSRCMRENGVPAFPDPDADGRIMITPGSGMDPESSDFRRAQEVCKDLAPQGPGGPGGGSLDAEKVTAWAECVRANGVPKFADPVVNGGEMEIDMGGAGIDPNDPAFQRAIDACKDKYPGGAVKMKGGPR